MLNRPFIFGLGSLLAAWMLVACGGGESDTAQTSEVQTPFDVAKVAEPGLLEQIPVLYELTRRRILAAGGSTTASGLEESFFNWVEYRFPELAPGHVTTTTVGAYRLRYYAASDFYLAISGSRVLALGRLTAWRRVDLGAVQEFLAAALNDLPFQSLPPVAQITAPTKVYPNRSVDLYADASYSRQGVPLSGQSWALVAAPVSAPLFNGAEPRFNFYSGYPGTYAVELQVTDSQQRTSAKTRTQVQVVRYDRTCPNTVPGRILTSPDSDVYGLGVGQVVHVDACNVAQGVPDVSPWMRWTMSSRPDGSSAALEDIRTESTSFIADMPGSYTLMLEVQGVTSSKILAQRTINVLPKNATEFFREVVRGIPNFSFMADQPPGGLTSSPSTHGAATVDLDGDGRKELVVTVSWSATAGAGPVTRSALTRVFILGLDASGRMQDVTKQYLDDGLVLEGWTGITTVADMNGDGRPDLIIPLTQDDGRSAGEANLYDARPVVLMSGKDGRLRPQTIPIPLPGYWGTSVVGKAATGLPFITGTVGAEAPMVGYYWNGASFSKSTELVPDFIPSIGVPIVMEFIPGTGAEVGKQYAFGANGQTFAAFTREGSGAWKFHGSRSLGFERLGSITILRSYTGDRFSADVARIEGRLALISGGVSVDQFCPIKLPSGKVGVVYTLPVTFLSRQDVALTPDTVLLEPYSSDFEPVVMRLGFATVGPTGLELQSLDVEGSYKLSMGRLNCMDINGDGFQDIVWSPRIAQAQPGLADSNPTVLLGTTGDKFRVANHSSYQAMTNNQYQDALQALTDDFDGDGIADVVFFPGSIPRGNPANMAGNSKYFKGVRPLR